VTGERLSCVRQGRTAVIEIGNEMRRNSLRRTDWKLLAGLVESLANEPGVCAIVLAGRGGTFSAGSDLNDWVGADLEEVEQTFEEMEACFQAIERAPVAVLAAIEGVAAGAGCQLALACDLAVMSESARIGMPVARLGILVSAAFVARVSRRTGKAMAADLYLTGRLLTAEESARGGLVTRVVPTGSARAEATRIAGSIVSTPPSALLAAKRALANEGLSCGSCSGTSDAVDAPTVEFVEFGAAIRTFLPNQQT
jgi:enoyl-CoA hydratase/carnithine racemase